MLTKFEKRKAYFENAKHISKAQSSASVFSASADGLGPIGMDGVSDLWPLGKDWSCTNGQISSFSGDESSVEVLGQGKRINDEPFGRLRTLQTSTKKVPAATTKAFIKANE